MSTVEQIAEQLNKLTLLEAAQLSKLLQETWGVSAAAPMAVAAVPGAAGAPAGGAGATHEKTEYHAILSAAGGKENQENKVLRGVARLGVQEANELGDGAQKPEQWKGNQDRAEAGRTES